MDTRNSYPTHLTENAWQLMHAYVAGAKPGGRPEKSPTRDMLHGIFDVVRSGCAWRLLPHDLPPEQIVYHALWRWRKDGTWPLMDDLLRGDVRAAAGKRRQPNPGIIDSQSVKTTEQGVSAALIPTHRSKAARGPSSSIYGDYCSPWSSPTSVCKTAMAPTVSWTSSSASFLARGSSGPIRPLPAHWPPRLRRCGGIGPYVRISSSVPRAPRALK